LVDPHALTRSLLHTPPTSHRRQLTLGCRNTLQHALTRSLLHPTPPHITQAPPVDSGMQEHFAALDTAVCSGISRFVERSKGAPKHGGGATKALSQALCCEFALWSWVVLGSTRPFAGSFVCPIFQFRYSAGFVSITPPHIASHFIAFLAVPFRVRCSSWRRSRYTLPPPPFSFQHLAERS
jgi:hypothetical protein